MDYLLRKLFIKKIIKNTKEYQVYFVKKNKLKNNTILNYLTNDIYQLIIKAWGDFGIKFIKNHVLKSDYLTLLYLKDLL